MTLHRNHLLRWSVVLLLVLTTIVTGQESNETDAATTAAPVPTDQWSGCVNPGNPNQLVTIGKKTTVCLTLANGMDWSTELTYIRLAFNPVADEYSRFHVPSCKYLLSLRMRDVLQMKTTGHKG